MIKKIFSIPGLIVFAITLIIAYLGLWMVLRSTVVSGVTEYIAELESEGYRVEHGGLSIDGFPISIDAHSPNITVRTTSNSPAAMSGNWTVEADNVSLKSATLTPLSWALEHRGDLSVNMRTPGAPRYLFEITPATIDSNIAYSLSGQLKSFKTNIASAQINPRFGDAPGILGFAGLSVDLNIKSGTGKLNIQAEEVLMSQQALGVAYNVLGPEISRLSLTGDIENWPLLETEGLETWMQSPATIKSDDWQILWGSADIVGSFDIGFKNGLPEGVLRFRVKNVDSFMQSLIAMNLIDTSFAGQLNTVVNAIDSDEDGRKSIEITIRDGVAKYGFFPLFRF